MLMVRVVPYDLLRRLRNEFLYEQMQSNRDDSFNELVSLLARNEGDEKNAADVERDMRRLLLLGRDSWLRDQLIQVQGVRRVTLISKAASSVATQRICAGILGNIAHSEQGRLSASSCDRWHCVSHRHQCPLSMLLANTQHSGRSDNDLMRISAAALLAFSVQNQCQRHLDTIVGIPVLLKLLDVKQANGAATDVAIFAAAILWNMCKAPAILLKLETTYGILKDQLTRKLTNLLATSLEPFELFLTPTGERGMPLLLDFDGENLNVLVTASISTQLTVVLSISNYVGRVRSLADQFRPKTPPAAAVANRTKIKDGTGKSVAHYDESGVLASCSCAVCSKLIRLSRKRSQTQPSLLCSRNGCGQMYHLKCSRWAVLSDQATLEIAAESGHFYCDVCVLKTPLCYWDFLAAHSQHEKLITQNQFNSVGITRVSLTPSTTLSSASLSRRSISETTASETDQQRQTNSTNSQHDTSATVDEDHSPWPSVMLFDQNVKLVGVGDKCFRISPSSRDPETYVVAIKYTTTQTCPAMRQVRAIPKKNSSASNNLVETSSTKWKLSYARPEALEIPVAPGNAVFWPAQFMRDIHALEYTRRSVIDLENAFLYEFQGEQPHDKAYSIGSSTNSSVDNDGGLWMALNPRKALCMKLLAAQLGHAKRFNEVQILHTKKDDKPRSTGSRKQRKPHFPGKQLNKIAIEPTS